MNILENGVVTEVEVEFNSDVAFATIMKDGGRLYVEFPVKYVDKTTCISNTPFNPEDYQEWEIDFECPIIDGDVLLYNWDDEVGDFESGVIDLDQVMLQQINDMLEITAAKQTLEGMED